MRVMLVFKVSDRLPPNINKKKDTKIRNIQPRLGDIITHSLSQ